MVMAMTAFSIVVCVFVLDLHHRNSSAPVPGWVRWLLMGRLSRCLGFQVRQYELGYRRARRADLEGAVVSEGHRHRGRSAADDTASRSNRPRVGGQDARSDPRRCGRVDLERITRRQNYLLAHNPVRTSQHAGSLWVWNVGIRRRNSLLADRRTSNGCVVGGSTAEVEGTKTATPEERYTVHDNSDQDAATSSENLLIDTEHLLTAILTQLRYITADMRRHCKRAEVKDEWKLVAKVIDRLLLLLFIVVITVLTIAILFVYPTLSNVDITFH